jgi:hypothetical protein
MSLLQVQGRIKEKAEFANVIPLAEWFCYSTFPFFLFTALVIA